MTLKNGMRSDVDKTFLIPLTEYHFLSNRFDTCTKPPICLCKIVQIMSNWHISILAAWQAAQGWQTLHYWPLSFIMVEYTTYWSRWQVDCRSTKFRSVVIQWIDITIHSEAYLSCLSVANENKMVLRKWMQGRPIYQIYILSKPDSKLMLFHRDGCVEFAYRYLSANKKYFVYHMLHHIISNKLSKMCTFGCS